MKKIFIVSGDTVDVNMGGVGVRSWELARALAKDFEVRLAVPNQTSLQQPGIELISFDLQKDDLRPYLEDVGVIITQGFVLHFHPYLRESGIPLAIDLYVPFLLEGLVWHHEEFESWIPAYEEYSRVQGELLRAGDFFFCASERQRDYWLGWLHAQKRINPHTYMADPTLRKLIDLVPFGLPEGKPKLDHPVLKGVHPGIGPNDRVLIWSGGIWDWLDPLTLIRAVAELTPRYPALKLYFLGTRHPNPVISGMSMPDRAIELSKQLEVYERSVFFGDWVPYEERSNYLAESDLSVVSHLSHIETHFSFRTRVLDCFWAGLPLVVTEGDAMSELVKETGIGIVVPPNDVHAMADAIEQLLNNLDQPAYEAAFDRLRERFCWENAIAPLRRFCQEPHFAPDKGHYLTDVERISRDKDAFLERVVADYKAIIADRDAAIERYRNMLPLRLYRSIKRILR